MKKLFTIMLMMVAGLVLVACQSGPTVVLYNWGDYMDPEVLREFRRQTGIRVKEVQFLDNETAITQIQNQQFDVAIPSDYAIEQLSTMDLIEEIDWSRINTINPNNGFTEGLVNLVNILNNDENPFDVLNWSVPYFWGSLGLLYNHTVDGLGEAIEELGWEALTDERFKIALYDSSRDGLAIALTVLGYSTNTTNETEVAQAEAWLINLKRNKAADNKISFVTDNVLDHMKEQDEERYDIAVVYSGDAVYLMEENENLSFAVPHQGTNVFVDGMIIPKGANMDYAYQLINFLISYEAAEANTLYVYYSTPRKDVFDEMIKPGGELEDYAESYNPVVRAQDEVYRYNPEGKILIDQAWERVRTS